MKKRTIPTIKEVRQILSADPSKEMIESLRHDRRKGIQQLVSSWERKMDRLRMLSERTEKLYILPDKKQAQGFSRVGGIDEAGRGPLAGPVVAACVCLRSMPRLPVYDSKKLSPGHRKELYNEITKQALAYGIGIVPSEEIDRINIYRAARKAMITAFENCSPEQPDFCFTDAMKLPGLSVPQCSLVHGDAICAPVAAASIIAKVTRDSIMEEADQSYPGYGFASNKGYGSAEHLAALAKIGPCPIHRRSFAPVKDYVLPSAEFFETMINRCSSLEALTITAQRIKRSSGDLTGEELEHLRQLYRKKRRRLQA